MDLFLLIMQCLAMMVGFLVMFIIMCVALSPLFKDCECGNDFEEDEYRGKFTQAFIDKERQALLDLNRHLTPFEVNYSDALDELEVNRDGLQ